MVAGHIVTEAHALVAATVHLGRALHGGGRRGLRGRLAYDAQGKARESDGAEERLFHEDGT